MSFGVSPPEIELLERGLEKEPLGFPRGVMKGLVRL
jgi:hypothetical protein